MLISPSVTNTSFFLDDYVSFFNINHVHFMGSYSTPHSENIGNSSFIFFVKTSSNCLMVQEAPTIYIPMLKFVVSNTTIYS
jgi:hypothetical protein